MVIDCQEAEIVNSAPALDHFVLEFCMFKGISLSSFGDFLSKVNLTESDKTEINEYKNKRKLAFESLKSFFLHDDIIDARKISEGLFPKIEADIFLSHSHADEELAISLAILLEDKFDIKVFVDSCVWAYADDLLKEIDDTYCKWPSGSYSYEMRNYSTAHVHMILNSALHTMIDKSELFVFIETQNSAPLKNYLDGDKTFSPWIFSELMFSSVVTRRTPERHAISMEKYALDEARKHESMEVLAKSLRVAHPVYTDHLDKIETAEFFQHMINCSEKEIQGLTFLDELYKKFSLA